MENKLDLLPLLDYIDPSVLDYQEWVNVGMALKAEGYSVSVWDDWSRRDAGRYYANECRKKWETFRGDTSAPVTGGTIVAMAKDNGWTPQQREDHELSWDDIIGQKEDMVLVDKNWIEGQEIADPENWDPVKELVTYLETLFDSTENVGYVTESWQKTVNIYHQRAVLTGLLGSSLSSLINVRVISAGCLAIITLSAAHGYVLILLMVKA